MITGFQLVSALAFFVMCKTSHAQPKKSQIFIGGWTTDSPEHFLSKFKPLFETYLNEYVGYSWNPPIEFSLIPGDYSEEQSFEKLMSEGQLDFACTSSFVFKFCSQTFCLTMLICVRCPSGTASLPGTFARIYHSGNAARQGQQQ